MAANTLNLRSLSPKLQEKLASEIERQRRLQAAAKDPFTFGRIYCSDYFESATPEFHRIMMQSVLAAEEKRRGIIIASPRNHGKSTLFSFLYPLWTICFKRRNFIVMIGATGGQVHLMLDAIKKELEQNDLLANDFGPLAGDLYDLPWRLDDIVIAHARRNKQGEPEVDRRGKYIPETTIRVVARSAEGALRGLRSGSHRPDLTLLDDVDSDEHVNTPEQRAKIKAWFTRAVEPLMDPNRGTLVMVGTILHYDSLLANLLERSDVYDTHVYKAIKDDGTPLWPERWSLEALEDRRRVMGSASFNQEYMNNPLDDEARRFRPEWLAHYTREETLWQEGRWWWRGQPLKVVQAYDLAIRKKDTADEFAMATVGITPQGQFVVLECKGAHLDFPEQVRMVQDRAARWHPQVIGIENVAYQDALRQQIMSISTLPIQPIRAKGDKPMRITAMSPWFEQGKVFIRRASEGEPGVSEPETGVMWGHDVFPLVQQLLQYPKVAHDDLLDALEMAIRLYDSHPVEWKSFGNDLKPSGWRATTTPSWMELGVDGTPKVKLSGVTGYQCRTCGQSVTITRANGEFYCGECLLWGLPMRVTKQGLA